MTRFSTFDGPRKPLNKVSPRKMREDAELADSRAVIRLRSGGHCEAKLDGCRGFGTEAHHVLRRSQGGKHDPDSLLWVCRACHESIHRSPADAYDKGLLRRSWDKSSPPDPEDRSALAPQHSENDGATPWRPSRGPVGGPEVTRLPRFDGRGTS